MTSTAFSLDQSYQIINDLLKKEKFLEAHRACLELLRFDPENIKTIRLKNKIDRQISENNRQLIEKNLRDLKPLWDEKKYSELLIELKKLAPYINDYPPLKNIILKAEKDYNQELFKQRQKHYETEYKNILTLTEQKKFPEAVRESEKLRTLQIHDEEIKKLLKTIRTAWIKDEISSNEILIKSEKHEDILLLYQSLKRIDPLSSYLENSIKTAQKDYARFKIDEKKEFIYKGLIEIKTLYQLKKYEKALQGIQEILMIDPFNKQANTLLKNTSRKINHQIEAEVITQMLGSQKQLQKEFETAPQTIKKI